MKKQIVVVVLWVGAVALVLTGCSGVITPEPESEVSTPVPTDVGPLRSPTSAAPLGLTPSGATPTPTPTPTIHVIQEGETLGGIAAAYGVSVRALQTANGIENPLLLQVGQELVIPSGEEEAEPEPDLLLPTPTPLPFGVRGVGFYETAVGSLDCLGEVVNTTPYTMTNVQVRVSLFDDAGTLLIEQDAFSGVDVLYPSDRAPFRILFLSPPPNFASHQVTVLRGEFAGALAEGYIPLTVEEETLAPSGPQYEVSGVVSNPDAEQVASRVVVLLTTYGGEGLVTGVSQRSLDVGEGLAPGAATPFNWQLSVYGGTPSEFSVIALGRTGEVETQPEG